MRVSGSSRMVVNLPRAGRTWAFPVGARTRATSSGALGFFAPRVRAMS
jgi:hypothetical protein